MIRFPRLGRRALLLLGLLTLAAGVALAWLVPTSHFVFLGLVRGQRFYEGRPIPYWVYVLEQGGGDHDQALRVMRGLGPWDREAVPLLIDALRYHESTPSRLFRDLRESRGSPAEAAAADARQRQAWAAVAEALGHIGPDAREAAPILIKYLPVRGVSDEAATALVGIGPAAVPDLVTTFQDERKRIVHPHILAVLGRLGPDAREAVPALVQRLPRNANAADDERALVASTLGEVGPAAKEAVPALIETIRAKKFGPVESEAVITLGKIGPEAHEAVPVLTEMLRDLMDRSVLPDSGIIFWRKRLLRALKRIDPDAATKAATMRPPLPDEAIDRYDKALHLPGLEVPEMIARLDEAIALAPNFPWAYLYRGVLYAGLGQRQRGLADFDRAIRLEPSSSEAH
jgi:tetratricopeptide (TPR) repeat protein